MSGTDDFLQADDLSKTIKVPFAVAAGKVSDDEIEAYIGADSKGRQGRYYRLAAEKLGLITTQNNVSSLTLDGQHFVSLPDNKAKLLFMKDAMQKNKIFKEAIDRIGQGFSRQELLFWFKQIYPGSEGTADRRFSTLIKYLRKVGYTI